MGGPPPSGGHAGGHAVIDDVVEVGQQVEIFKWATNLVGLLIAAGGETTTVAAAATAIRGPIKQHYWC